MEKAFDKHPGVLGADKNDPFKITYVALREDPVHRSSVIITNKRQMDEVLAFLNSHRDVLPD